MELMDEVRENGGAALDRSLSVPSWREHFQEALRMSGLLALARRVDSRRPNLLRVLLYHRILDREGLVRGDPNLISASPDGFAQQMQYLVRHYTLISAEHLIRAVRQQTTLPPQAVLVTFDDGYRDFLVHAWPVLCRYKVPAILFVPTGFPGTGQAFWWDALYDAIFQTTKLKFMEPRVGTLPLRTPLERWRAVRWLNRDLQRLKPAEIERVLDNLRAELEVPPPIPAPVLTWDELRHLVSKGLTVAPHTRSHPALPTLTPQEMAEEIAGGYMDLLRELGHAYPLFSYPLGLFDQRVHSVLQANKILAAFTSTPGLNTLGQANPLKLRRRAINASRSFTEFCFSCTSLYASVQHRSWQRRRRTPAYA